MSNKPKIYANCKAGCLWETVHKDDFDRSATWLKQYPDENNVYELPPVKNYKIVSPVSSDAYSCVVSLLYSHLGSQFSHEFTISEFDPYRSYFYFEILSMTTGSTDGGEKMSIVYEVNGNRYLYEEVEATGYYDFSSAKLKITGATAVYGFNDDASITGNGVDIEALEAELKTKLSKPTGNPIPDSVVVVRADGSVYYKALSELGGGGTTEIKNEIY